MVSASDIIDVIKIHPLKIRNIFLFGSQIYGNQRDDSDYDFIVVACNMLEKQEIRHENLNVHTPDIFLNGLKEYQMNYLECIYAPSFAKIQEKMIQPDKNFSLKIDMLKYKGMNQSFTAFHKAKERVLDGELYRGVKSMWHSFRILQFFKQIVDSDYITDFASANQYWDMMKEDMEHHEDWDFYKEKYLPMKIELETSLNR